MRYRALFLVMHASAAELEPALRRRVDAMVDAGLVQELETLAAAAGTGAGAGNGRGLGQAIGFHEWGAYFRARGFAWMDTADAAWGGAAATGVGGAAEAGADLDALRDEAVEAMKGDTCRLARRQLRRCHRLTRRFGWVLRHLDSTGTHAGLRAGDAAAAASAWSGDVYEPALAAVKAFLAEEDNVGGGEVESDGGSRICGGGGGAGDGVMTGVGRAEASGGAEEWVEHACDACNRTLRGETEWRAHVGSRSHRKRMSNLRKAREGKHGTLAPAAASSRGDGEANHG
jgi:tRNA dimethylallyltransferase